MADEQVPSPVRPGHEQLVMTRGLVGLYALALALRAAFILAEPRTRLVGDEQVWTALADQLAAATPSFSPLSYAELFRPPLYVYFIAMVQGISGTLVAVAWAQAAIGALLAPLVALIATTTGNSRVALSAGLLAAIYPELIWYSAHFWAETLFVVLICGSIERLCRHERQTSAVVTAGVLWGLACLTRETALFLIPFVVLWLMWPRPRAWKKAALFVGACVIVVLPWTVRNFWLTGSLVPVATRGAFNLWLANAEDSGAIYAEYYSLPGGEMEKVRYAQARAVEAISAQQPWWIVNKIRREMPAFWGVHDHLVNHIQRRGYQIPLAGRWGMVLTTVLAYLALLALAFPWLAAAAKERTFSLLLLLLFVYLGMHVVAFGSSRFRLPFLPVLFLLAARSLTFGWFAAWRGQGRAERALTIAIGVLLLASLVPSIRETLSDPSLQPNFPTRAPRPSDRSVDGA